MVNRALDRNAREKLRGRGLHDYGGAAFGDAGKDTRDDELDDLAEAAADSVRRRARTDPRLAERLRQHDLARQFADAIDTSSSTAKALEEELFGTTDTKEQNR